MMFIWFVVLIFLSGFFSGAEIAFFSLSKAQARQMLDQKKKNASLVWRLKQKPQWLLITILIGNNIVNILTASLATVMAVDLLGDIGVGIATGVVTLVILVFGEITPKSLAQKNNQWIALKTAPIFYFLIIIFYPISWLLIKFNNFVANKIFKVRQTDQITESEIRAMARLGVESGAIDYREREMIENVLELNDKEVSEIMTPRYKMVVLNGDVPIDQIAFFVAQTGYSRYPVYEDEEDHIVGYVHVNDILRKLKSDKRDFLVKNIARPIRRVGEDKNIEHLFRSIINRKDHMVLVTRTDDKNEVIGLVTLEDILEEIVGEIQDETDLLDEKRVK